MTKQLFTRADIERFGFKYEPDGSKCIDVILHNVDKTNKSSIVRKVGMKYVNSIFEQRGNIYVRGYGNIDIL